MSILVFLITSTVQFLIASFGFFILLLALNGYSERFATPGLVMYVLVSLVITLGLASLAAFVTKKIVGRKRLSSFAAGSLSTVGFSLLGGIFMVAAFFVCIGIAELLRTM